MPRVTRIAALLALILLLGGAWFVVSYYPEKVDNTVITASRISDRPIGTDTKELDMIEEKSRMCFDDAITTFSIGECVRIRNEMAEQLLSSMYLDLVQATPTYVSSMYGQETPERGVREQIERRIQELFEMREAGQKYRELLCDASFGFIYPHYTLQPVEIGECRFDLLKREIKEVSDTFWMNL